MKKILSTILIFITLTVPAQGITSISPSFYCGYGGFPALSDISFAEESLDYFFGTDYQIIDNFKVSLEYPYAHVRFMFDAPLEYNHYMVVVFNEKQHYYMTPVIVGSCMLCDFTNVVPDNYNVYVVSNP